MKRLLLITLPVLLLIAVLLPIVQADGAALPPESEPAPMMVLPPGPIFPAHYRDELYERYEAYGEKYPDVSWSGVIALVNIGADLPFYTDVQTITEPDALDVLCNKIYRLPDGYEPEHLRVALDSSQMLREDAADALEAMAADMDALGMRLVLRSGYRSFSVQATIFSRQVKNRGMTTALKFYAKSGHSEHQTGLAADVLHYNTTATMGSVRFEKTKQYRWLLDNAHRYGYILRYPDGYTHITGYSFEPWHWRYIGVEAATDMYERGIATYEEYCGRFIS